MHGEGPALTEALATFLTLEGLFLAVNVPVVPEVVLPPESMDPG